LNHHGRAFRILIRSNRRDRGSHEIENLHWRGTWAFEQVKKELAPVAAAANKEEMDRPSLKITREQGCEPPQKLEYKPGQPIEELYSIPIHTMTGPK
jgi:hypothetical protein